MSLTQARPLAATAATSVAILLLCASPALQWCAALVIVLGSILLLFSNERMSYNAPIGYSFWYERSALMLRWPTFPSWVIKLWNIYTFTCITLAIITTVVSGLVGRLSMQIMMVGLGATLMAGFYLSEYLQKLQHTPRATKASSHSNPQRWHTYAARFHSFILVVRTINLPTFRLPDITLYITHFIALCLSLCLMFANQLTMGTIVIIATFISLVNHIHSQHKDRIIYILPTEDLETNEEDEELLLCRYADLTMRLFSNHRVPEKPQALPEHHQHNLNE